MEIKIGKIKLGVTSNGTSKVHIYPEGSDFNNTSEAIEVIGDLESLYAMTRKSGETIEIIEKGKWKNLKIDDEYVKVFNSPNYERVKNLFKRSVVAVNEAINGSRTSIDFDTAKVLMADNLELQLKTQDFILSYLKKSNTVFAKQLVNDIKSDDVNAKFEALNLLNQLAIKNISEINKDYKIENGEDCKEKTS